MLKIGKKFLFPIILFIAIVPAFFALLKPGYYNMHDDMQIIRQLELEKCLKDGQIPCRWSPDLGYEYGYPLFNFYPPMPYIVGQVFRTLGLSFVNTVKATAVVQFILAAAFMYLLASSIFGKMGGLIAALFYTYAPYHAVNIYVRGAMNEAWALVFFPLIFYYARNLIINKKIGNIIGIAIGYAGLLLSHNPMILIFTPVFFIWCLFWFISENHKNLFKNFTKQIPLIIKFILSGLFALSLTAFFTIPLLSETKYVQIASMFTGYYSYSIHFTTLNQLFITNFWGDGPSVWGPNDGMSFMVGYLHWIIPLLIIMYSGFVIFIKKEFDKKIQISLLLAILGFGAVFMTHNKSTFIWQIFPQLQQIQFPWRFLNLSAFLLSLSVGIMPFILKKHVNKKIETLIIIGTVSILVAINISHFAPVKSGPLTDQEKFSGKAWNNQITSGIYDYLPITASTAAKSEAKPYIDNIDPEKSLISLSGQKKGTDWLFFNLFLNQDAKITISQLAFPNFEITDKGQKIDYQIEPELGRMVVNLKAGDHQIYVKLKNTPIRIVSNYISLFAWLGLIAYLLKPLWKKLIFRK